MSSCPEQWSEGMDKAIGPLDETDAAQELKRNVRLPRPIGAPDAITGPGYLGPLP